MKQVTYAIRPVVDKNDLVLYWEFVRVCDDAILFSHCNYEFIFGYASGYVAGVKSQFVIY